MNKHAAVAVFLCALVVSPVVSAQTPTLTIQADRPVAKVSPTLYGLMTEEINYSYDGGLYAELVRDRTLTPGFGALTHWPMVARGNAQVNLSLDESTGPSAVQPRSLKVHVTAASPDAPGGVENGGYWGIAVRPHTIYRGSFYAKTDAPGVPVTITLANDETGHVAATATVGSIGSSWRQYHFTLQTGAVPVTANNHLILTIARPASLWLDLVSLFPPTYHDRPGGNRIDLMEKLAGLHPQFLRFPAGIIWRASALPTASSGRTPSARWSIGLLTPVRGAIAPPTAWGCSNSWSGART